MGYDAGSQQQQPQQNQQHQPQHYAGQPSSSTPMGLATGIPIGGGGLLPPSLVPTLQRYQQLTQSISHGQTSQLEQRSSQAEAALRSATARLGAAQQGLASVSAQLAKDEVKMHKAGDPNFLKKALFPGRCATRVEEMHARLTSDASALASAESGLAAAASAHAAAGAAAGALRPQLAAWQADRQAESQLVEGLFAAPHCPLSDAAEGQMRAQYAALAPQTQQLRQYQAQYATAAGVLKSALHDLVGSQQAFAQGLQLANFDVMEGAFRGPFRGPDLMDMMVVQQETQCAQQGAVLYQSAANKIIQAKGLCPDVPRIDLQLTQQVMGAFAHMVFDGFFVDMIVRQQIATNLAIISGMLENVRFACHWMDTTLLTRVNADLAAREAQTIHLRNQLDVHRRALLNGALAAGGAAPQQQQQHGAPPQQQQQQQQQHYGAPQQQQYAAQQFPSQQQQQQQQQQYSATPAGQPDAAQAGQRSGSGTGPTPGFMAPQHQFPSQQQQQPQQPQAQQGHPAVRTGPPSVDLLA